MALGQVGEREGAGRLRGGRRTAAGYEDQAGTDGMVMAMRARARSTLTATTSET